MAKKTGTTRKSLGIKGSVFNRILFYCGMHKKTTSGFLEEIIEDAIGPATAADEAQYKAYLETKQQNSPKTGSAEPIPDKDDQEGEFESYIPPIQLF